LDTGHIARRVAKPGTCDDHGQDENALGYPPPRRPMEREQPQAAFDHKCASGYDQQCSRTAPPREALHLLIGAALGVPRADEKIL
jgi:hypothetical protein